MLQYVGRNVTLISRNGLNRTGRVLEPMPPSLYLPPRWVIQLNDGSATTGDEDEIRRWINQFSENDTNHPANSSPTESNDDVNQASKSSGPSPTEPIPPTRKSKASPKPPSHVTCRQDISPRKRKLPKTRCKNPSPLAARMHSPPSNRRERPASSSQIPPPKRRNATKRRKGGSRIPRD